MLHRPGVSEPFGTQGQAFRVVMGVTVSELSPPWDAYSTVSGLTTYNRGPKCQLLSVSPFAGHLVFDLHIGLAMHCVLNLETGGKEDDRSQQVLLHAAHHFLFLPNQLSSFPDGYNQCLKMCFLLSSLKSCLNLSSWRSLDPGILRTIFLRWWLCRVGSHVGPSLEARQYQHS